MPTYKVNYIIKRNAQEFEASHITEASCSKEAIQAARAYAQKKHLPHPFRPKAYKLTDYELSSVAWKQNSITRSFMTKHREVLLFPHTMTPQLLCEVMTYCENIHNPYSEEILKRAGLLAKFITTYDEKERRQVLGRAAKAFGITLC